MPAADGRAPRRGRRLLAAAAAALALPTLAAAPAPEPALPDGLRCLLAAYPATVCSATPTELVLCSGERFPWDDGRTKPTFDAVLNDPDLEEAMAQRYRPGPFDAPPPLNFEPGRIRYTPLFAALYGTTRAAVRANLRPVEWLPKSGGRTVLMSRVNGADRALAQVSDAIERELPPELRKLAANTSGTFNWRTVRGTTRRSMHSFGIAIDIGVPQSDYWAWNRPDATGAYRYKNRFPLEIVEIFERYGFIWGGKWHHFDTMHFEYRPELLTPPCVAPR